MNRWRLANQTRFNHTHTGMDWKEKLKALADADPTLDPSTLPPEEPSSNDDKIAVATQHLRVDIERKGRKGKTATIISGFDCDDSELRQLLTKLQKHLGTGGSARGGEILLQGDCRQKVVDFLRSLPNIKI